MKKRTSYSIAFLVAGLSVNLLLQQALAVPISFDGGTGGGVNLPCAAFAMVATPSAIPTGVPTSVRFSWTQRRPKLVDNGGDITEDITNTQTGVLVYSNTAYANPVTLTITITTSTVFELNEYTTSGCETTPIGVLVAATNPVCGNGIIETGETCDNGSLNGTCPATCSTSCTPNVCGVGSPSFDQGNGTTSVQSTQPGTYSIPIIVTGKDSATGIITSTSTVTLNVTIGSSLAGTVNVTSTNFTTGALVKSSWDVIGASLGNVYPSNNVSQTTNANIPLDMYTVAPVTNSAGTLYALHGVGDGNIALNTRDPRLTGLFSVLNWLAPEAKAFNRVCGALNISPTVNYGTSNPCVPSPTMSLTAALNAANFVILWDPLASISLSQSAMTSDSSKLNGAITVTNNGAQGSILSWNTSIAYAKGSGWLTISPASNASLNQGVPQTVNVSVNPAGLTLGSSYKAVVTFSGTTASSLTNGPVLPQTLTVTFNVTSGGPVKVKINSPTPVAQGVPAQVTCTGGSGSYQWSSTGPATFNSTSGSTVQVTYSSPGTYHLTCTDPGGGGSDTKSIVITADCTISASPALVVPPQSSKLNWSCEDKTATSCTINGTTVCNTVESCSDGGSLPVAPQVNTTYILSCTPNNGIPGSTMPAASATVSVRGPGVHETNP